MLGAVVAGDAGIALLEKAVEEAPDEGEAGVRGEEARDGIEEGDSGGDAVQNKRVSRKLEGA